MARLSAWLRIAALSAALVLFVTPIVQWFGGATSYDLDFPSQSMTLAAVLLLGVAARSWLEAVVGGIAFAMIATGLYAGLGFGWFHTVSGQAQIGVGASSQSAAVDILVWTPALSAALASLGYGARRIVLGVAGVLAGR